MLINHVLWGTVACFQNNSKSDNQHFAKLQETADFLPYFLSDKQQCSKRQQIFFRAALATTSSCLGSFWVQPWTPATACHSHRSNVQPQTDGVQMDHRWIWQTVTVVTHLCGKSTQTPAVSLGPFPIFLCPFNERPWDLGFGRPGKI